jgi:hypothetical protein
VRQASCAIQPVEDRPSKGQRPLGSGGCVTPGDSGREAYTAIAWGVGLSPEPSDIRSEPIDEARGTYEFQAIIDLYWPSHGPFQRACGGPPALVLCR